MHITKKDFKKYILFSLFFLWLILFFHLWYLYLQAFGKNIPTKWWILLEWVVWAPINPLPYLWNWYYSKYVQSLLYRWCIDSNWQSDLCIVKTNDNKTYVVSMTWNNYWKDWTKITLNDVFFTYNDIIKNNSLNLDNPVANNLKSIKKQNNTIIVTFNQVSINNINFFKNYILPKNVLENSTKNYYVLNYSKQNINSTCVNLDLKSDFTHNVILDYSKCQNYFINKYQFVLWKNINDIKQYFTWTNKIDIYNWWTNIDPKHFKTYKINLPIRYAMFWNTKKGNNEIIKTYLSKKILSYLKNDLAINNKIRFIWYGLFILHNFKLTETWFKQELIKNILKQKQLAFKNKLFNITWNVFSYKQWKDNKAFIWKVPNYLTMDGLLSTGWYDKIWISYKSWNIYILKTYKWTNKFKYIISKQFWNIKKWKNSYKIFAYKNNKKQLLDTIILYYKAIDYPEFKKIYPSFTFLYLNKWLISNIWDSIVNILTSIYPWQILVKKVWEKEYNSVLNSWDYDLTISSVNFLWKDISFIFRTDNPINNPSIFKNANLSSLINQYFLASNKKLQNKILSELTKIYQSNVPVVFIWNKTMNLYINKKYNIPSLDYSIFANRKKLLKNIVLVKLKQTNFKWVSFKWFISFLKNSIK